MDALMNTTPGGGGKPVRISTKEIAFLTDKEHKTVLRDTRSMLVELYCADLVGDFAPAGVTRRAETIRSKADEILIKQYGPGTNWYHLGFEIIRSGNATVEILLDREHAMTLVTGYDIKLRKRVVDKLSELEQVQTSIPTTAEALAQVFRMVADSERAQAQQTAFNAQMAERVEIVEQTAALKAKPQNAETRSEVRRRMNRVHGLSEVIVDTVLDHAGYGIRPFAMVKNSHEDAQGSSYGVYWIRDISALFKRFASECRPHSATMVRHPIISRPFKLAKGGAK